MPSTYSFVADPICRKKTPKTILNVIGIINSRFAMNVEIMEN